MFKFILFFLAFSSTAFSESEPTFPDTSGYCEIFLGSKSLKGTAAKAAVQQDFGPLANQAGQGWSYVNEDAVEHPESPYEATLRLREDRQVIEIESNSPGTATRNVFDVDQFRRSVRGDGTIVYIHYQLRKTWFPNCGWNYGKVAWVYREELFLSPDKKRLEIRISYRCGPIGDGDPKLRRTTRSVVLHLRDPEGAPEPEGT